MWTTKLLVLGLVRWLQPVHGYDVQRELLSWNVEQWAQVKPGSIYHALKKLAADGYLSVVSTQQVDNRPARTSYEITGKGEDEFQSLLREKLWEIDQPTDLFWVAWSFVPVLSIRESTAMLRNRANRLRDGQEQIKLALKLRSSDPARADFIPPHIAAMMELKLQLMGTTAQWSEDTAQRIEAGEIYSAEDHQMSAEQAAHWRTNIGRLDKNGRLPD